MSWFLQYGWAPPDRNVFEHYLGCGLAHVGPFAGRDDDVAGIAMAQVHFSDDIPNVSMETSLEMFYRAPVTDRLTLHPDMQYIFNPGGNGRDAFVFGLRFEATL